MTAGSAGTDSIERDLEHTRARLDATLDALQQKLSPGQMVDQAMNWFKEGNGADFGRNLGRNVRDNPIPVALIGIGLGWLMVNGGRRRPEGEWDAGHVGGHAARGGQQPRVQGSEFGRSVAHRPMPYEAAAAHDDLAARAADAGARVERGQGEAEDAYRERVYAAKGAVLGVTRQVGETLSTFGDRVEAAVEAAAERFRRLAGSAGDVAGRVGDRAGEIAHDAMERGQAGLRSLYGYGQSAAYGVRDGAGQVTSRALDVGSRTTDYLKEQPILMGVVGVAVGAVLGMLVAPTRYERELAGDLRRSLGDQARETASDLGQRAMRVAETVLDTAHDAAQREGLTGVSPGGVAHGAREQVTEAARGVRKVVEETVASGKDAVRREAEGVGAGGTSAAPQGSAPGTATGGGTAAAVGSTPGAGEQHGDRRPFA